MSERVDCPNCYRHYFIEPEFFGEVLTCANCGHEFTATRPIEPEIILAATVEETPAETASIADDPFPKGSPAARSLPLLPADPRPRGWMATHKLLIALIGSVVAAIPIGVLMDHYVMVACIAVAGGVVVPFGLRAYPGWKQSRSWVPFLAISVPALFVGITLVYVFRAEQYFLNDEMARFTLARAAVLCLTTVIPIGAALLYYFGFFRPAAWALVALAVGYVGIGVPMTVAMRTARAATEQQNRQKRTAAAEYRVSADCGGYKRVVTVNVSNVPEDAAQRVDYRVISAASKLPEYRAETPAPLVYVIGPVDDIKEFAATLDFGQIEIDEAERVIAIRADPRRLPDPPPEIEDPSDGRFYKQNIADLSGWNADRRARAMDRLANCAPDERQRRDILDAIAPLLDDADGDVLRRAAWVYCSHSRSEEIPQLIEMLDIGDPEARKRVIDALAATKDPRAAEMLLVGSTGNGAIRIDALIAMGPVAEDAVLASLERGEAAENGWGNSASYCEVLGEVGTEKSLPMLLKLSSSRVPFVSTSATSAARKVYYRQLTASGSLDELSMVLFDLRLNSHYSGGACRKLSLMSPDDFPGRKEEVCDALLAALPEMEASYRNQASAIFTLWRTPEATTAIIEQFEQADAGEARSMVSLLATLEDERATKAMVDRLIAGTVALQTPTRQGPRAIRVLSDSDNRVLVSQLNELLRRRGPPAEEALLDILAESSDGLRTEIACDLLRTMGTERSLPRLRELAEGPDENVQRIAGAAVKEIQKRNQRDYLAIPGL